MGVVTDHCLKQSLISCVRRQLKYVQLCRKIIKFFEKTLFFILKYQTHINCNKRNVQLKLESFIDPNR